MASKWPLVEGDANDRRSQQTFPMPVEANMGPQAEVASLDTGVLEADHRGPCGQSESRMPEIGTSDRPPVMRPWSKAATGELARVRHWQVCADAPSSPATCSSCCSKTTDRHRGYRPAHAPLRVRAGLEPLNRDTAVGGEPVAPPPTMMNSNRPAGAFPACVTAMDMAQFSSAAKDRRDEPCSVRGCCRQRGARTMQRSETRILTTHAGSLPRPAELTTLFAKRVRGEAVDPAAIEAQGRAALRAIVKKQIDAGLDVIDDGEQSRESFVLYLRHRLTGLGGSGTRPMHADLDKYPAYKAEFQSRTVGKDTVSNRAILPKAIGPVAYADPTAIESECRDFGAALTEAGGGYVEIGRAHV